MLELDECDQLLVANPFADDSQPETSNNSHDTPGDTVTTVFDASSQHPLRSRSVSPAGRCDTPGIPLVIVIGGEGELRLQRSPTESEEDQAPLADSDVNIHPVGPNDSFAGVALRYGVSIAALRRANRLWPSDPIHLRTELFIPRGDTLRTGHKPIPSATADTLLRSTVDSTPDVSPDLVASSFVAARSVFLSILPGRLSLESLSSKASASEDHELDDFRTARAYRQFTTEVPFAQDGVELSMLAAPHAEYRRSSVVLASQVPCSPVDHQRLGVGPIRPLRDARSRSISPSPTVSLEHLPRKQPFAVLPVRTSQLEPEPAMELPVRRSRI